jgi:hypothetical protein
LVAFTSGVEVSARDLRDMYPLIGVTETDVAVNQTIDWEPVPGLTVIVAPDTAYALDGYVGWSAVPPGIRVGIVYPPSAVGRWGMQRMSPDVGPPGTGIGNVHSTSSTNTGPDNVGSSGGALGAAAYQYGLMRGYLQTGSDGGSVQLVFTQESAISTFVTIHAGSWMTLSKMGNV